MPTLSGPLKKLSAKISEPVHYLLSLSEKSIALNELIGQEITIQFNQAIYCLQCDRKTSKSFQQGYCYPCYRKLLDCNLCIIHPERCNYPHKACPNTWEHAQCKQAHIVYLANTSGLKVGITRQTSLQTRWVDQGAIQGIPLLKVMNRYHAGLLEVLFKRFTGDKTNWRKMLSNGIEVIDLSQAREQLFEKAEEALNNLAVLPSEIERLNDPCLNLTYPVLRYPKKLTAFTLDKQQSIAGTLLGIKGQYLLFEEGVFNVRKHSGYHINFSWSTSSLSTVNIFR
jgi:hypothetical protein